MPALHAGSFLLRLSKRIFPCLPMLGRGGAGGTPCSLCGRGDGVPIAPCKPGALSCVFDETSKKKENNIKTTTPVFFIHIFLLQNCRFLIICRQHQLIVTIYIYVIFRKHCLQPIYSLRNDSTDDKTIEYNLLAGDKTRFIYVQPATAGKVQA